MPPKPLYEIKPDAYLFVDLPEKPEEKIRQWVLFELLSTYGISIKNIEIERPVKVGTRTHRADIVILRESAPYVVIECKRWENKKIAAGIDQAISYADANTMKAKYAVFTNGDVWIVKRKVKGEWLDVPDISKRIDENYKVDLETLIRAIDDFRPVFYWLNQTIPRKDAKAFFSQLQVIFNGSTFPLDCLDKNMRFATDNLLRVISCDDSDDARYRLDKMLFVCKSYGEYVSRVLQNDTRHLSFKDYSLREMAVHFQIYFNNIVENSRGITGEEIAFNRFIFALLQYLVKSIKREKDRVEFIDVPSVLMAEFQNLISMLFDMRLGVVFPDSLLEESCTGLRHLCSAEWERSRAEAS